MASNVRQLLSRRLAPHLSGHHLPSSSSFCSKVTFSRSVTSIMTCGFASITNDNNNNVDTLIIGGGPMGLSTAYHLATQYRDNDGSDIVIVEQDPTYARSSATLSAGGIRQQFSLKENVQMSLYGRDFLRNAHHLLQVDDDKEDDDVDVQFQEHGYLFLASTPTGREQMIQNNQVQQSAGVSKDDMHLMDPFQLKQQFPWLNTEDIVLGSYGSSGEGWFDPWALIRGLKRKCQSMGVTFIKGSPVGAVREKKLNGRVLSVDVLEEEDKKDSVVRYNVQHVVNAAGANCSKVMETLATGATDDANGGSGLLYPIPVEPRKRCIFFIHCNTHQTSGYIVPQIAPLTICPQTGVYFRSEGLILDDGEPTGNFLCGVSPSQDIDKAIGDISELDYADYELWDEIIWPALYHRVPAFGEVKVKSSWAGLYEYNTMDQNAIIDFHPEMENVAMVNGFSGHGLQQSPASGRAVAELLSCNGKFVTLDLSIFGFGRCCENRPIFEQGIV